MSHNDFNELRHTAAALPPEQMRQLRDELDRKLSALPAAGADPDTDPLWQERPTPPAVSHANAALTDKPIWERILERSAAIPDEEFDKLPTDLAEQHDHYLYGTPKRPSA
jgi:hypothetical protein